MPGTIYLMNGQDVVKERRYSYSKSKADILDMWKKLYGRKFKQLWVHDLPDEPKNTKSKFKKGSLTPKTKIDRERTRKKSTKGGVIW